MSFNEVPLTIVGNLTDEPELRFTPGGEAVVKFSVAVNRRTFDKQTQEWRDAEPSFYRVVAWRHLAEHVAESLRKGMRVIVTGGFRQHHWTDEKSGEKRSGWELQAAAAGPDLTYATATVTKTARAGGTAPDDPWNTASRQRPAAAAAAPAAGYSDEPPF